MATLSHRKAKDNAPVAPAEKSHEFDPLDKDVASQDDQHPDSEDNESSVAEKPVAAPAGLLVDQPQGTRWRNWWIRGALTWAMLLMFAGIIYLGHVALTIMIFALQLKSFHEVISIAHVRYKENKLPWFRTLNWYFLAVANFYFYGEGFGRYYQQVLYSEEVAFSLVRFHRFISFSLYILGFCAFVLSLKKGYYKFQFIQFGWCHLALLLIVSQSHLIIQNMFNGLVWLLMPSSLVICNDIMAYMFGFFFGRTPLIKLSPKKTWEGFIGAFFSTVVFSLLFSLFLAQFQYFICPVERLMLFDGDGLHCTPNPVFQWTEMPVPGIVQTVVPWLGPSLSYKPFSLHAVIMAMFASLIAPFGGFFASGLKRAFQIKDFDNLIPGHGGVTDRFDCQFIMASFTYVYYHSFVLPYDLHRILLLIAALPLDQQREIQQRLQSMLPA
eukprot:m.19748 g.19748  ORF g.19748 m.19748 type:complete len:440 (-) comp3468_c0_seq1:48-1367(-)